MTTRGMLDPLNAAAGLFGRLSQTERLLRLHTPLGSDLLFAEDVEVWEGIGPTTGPALGDDGHDARPADSSHGAFDAALGPVRAGLRLVVHALGEDAHLELKTLVGQPALVELLCQDNRTERRPWHGHVVAAAMLGSDGGLARLRLVIEPWLSWLALTRDARVFQDASVPQVIDAVFAGYAGRGRLVPVWRWDLADAGVYPRRSLCIQYGESDLDFVLRLMREEGLCCWWEHAGDAASPRLGSHTLVIADHPGATRNNRQARVRFTGSDHTLGEDSLTRWTRLVRVTSARVAMRSHDHRSLSARPVEASVTGAVAAAPALSIVDVPGAYAYEDVAQGQRLASRQAEALAAVRTRVLARGPWRRAQAGTAFTLVDHPRHDGTDAARDDFVVLAAQHRARNNFSADEAARFVNLDRAILRDRGLATAPSRDDAAPLHDAALLVQPRSVPVRMGTADALPPLPPDDLVGGVLGRGDARRADAWPSLFDAHAVAALGQPEVRLNLRPTVRGTQTAIVVGDATGAEVHTDRDGRIRVQFHWQRGTRASHRLAAADGRDDAPAGVGSFTWVRVGASLAGANFGAVFTPRVGQEVVVAFTDGDIDRPVVIGVVYNGQGLPDAQGNRIATGAAEASGNAPAWFADQAPAGELEGHRHAAVLLGHKSQELGTSRTGLGGSNQLVFDDSAGGNRIELASTTRASRLQLGALLQQQDNQRLAPRGHGLELATAAHGALRAGAGLLLSAHAEPPSTDRGEQLEAQAPRKVLRAAQRLVRTLAGSAEAQRAEVAPKTPGTASGTEPGLQALVDSLQGRNATGSSGGGNAVAIDGGFGAVAAWTRPDLVLAAPSGIGLFTPNAAVASAGTHVVVSAGQDVHLIAQGRQSTVTRSGVVLYTCGRATDTAKPNTETGIALHAASGSVVASSHTGATTLTASGAVDVSSTEGGVRVAAPQQVRLMAAGAAIRLDAGHITLSAPGAVTFKAGMKVLTGPAAASAQFQVQHAGRVGPLDFDEVFTVTNDAGAPVAHRRYDITREDGALVCGTTDARGRIQQQLSFRGERIKLVVGGRG